MAVTVKQCFAITRQGAYNIYMKICLIGGAGFIGSNTARHLKALGHDVCVADIAPVS